jgi:hypothetical protein
MPNEKIEQIRAQTAAAANANVPIGMHPDQLDAHAPVLVDDLGGPGVAAFSAARNALQSLYCGLSEIDNAHAALLEPALVPTFRADGTKGKPLSTMQIPENRRAELSSAMASKAARLAAHIGRCTDDVDAAISALDTQVAAAIRHPRQDTASTVQEAAEIRNYVANHFRMQAHASDSSRRLLSVVN